jgi:purine-binding chemotaxis protein CheW
MNAQVNKGQAGLAGQSRQVLTFVLGAETYGVDILRVQELRGWSPVTRIPKSPEHVLGVLNLRGSIVPIVDMRLRFALERAEFTPLTVIIVMSVETDAGRREYGLVVDSVSEVVDIAAGDLKPAPDLGAKLSGEVLQGLATVQDKMVILLNVDRLLAHDNANLTAAAAA